jgi:hypothetical protein
MSDGSAMHETFHVICVAPRPRPVSVSCCSSLSGQTRASATAVGRLRAPGTAASGRVAAIPVESSR